MWKYKFIWFTASIILIMLFSISGCKSFRKRKPNIILFFSDDAGYADFGFQGNSKYRTPNLDKLASEGVKFTDGYVTASVCSPSRAGLMTGRYPQRFGHYTNLPGKPDPNVPDSVRGLPLSQITMADLLKKNGYVTGIIGKWHLGREPRFLPYNRGFDEFFGIPGGGSRYFYPESLKYLDCNYKDITKDSLPYLTDAFGNEAVDFIERHKNEPFFLYLSFNAPHTPLQAPDSLIGLFDADFRTGVRKKNAAMTTSLDENIGKVLSKLDELGLTENTLIVFTNDNGGAMPYNASLNDPLRGTKGTFLEGGIRVPFIMKWPKHIEPGIVYYYPVSTLDLLPTFLAAAGGKLPGDRDYPGVDLLPYLNGKNKERPHKILFWRNVYRKAVRKDDWKLVITPYGKRWLFNLDNDIGETTDLFQEHPEVAADLLSELHQWESENVEPIWVVDTIWRSHSNRRYDQKIVNLFKRD